MHEQPPKRVRSWVGMWGRGLNPELSHMRVSCGCCHDASTERTGATAPSACFIQRVVAPLPSCHLELFPLLLCAPPPMQHSTSERGEGLSSCSPQSQRCLLSVVWENGCRASPGRSQAWCLQLAHGKQPGLSRHRSRELRPHCEVRFAHAMVGGVESQRAEPGERPPAHSHCHDPRYNFIPVNLCVAAGQGHITAKVLASMTVVTSVIELYP